MKKIVPIITITAVGAGLLFAYFTFTSSKKRVSGKVYKIGVLAPLSGDSSSMGFSVLKGLQLAKKELGADHIEIISEDSDCDPDKAPEAFMLLADQNVITIVGEICSGASLAALPLANQNTIPMISAGSTSPKLSIANDYFFRTVPSDNLQGDFAAKYIYDKGYEKVGILYTNEDYGIAFNNVLTASFQKLGGEVVATVPFERTTLNMTSYLNQLKNARPDAIYIISNSTSSAVAALKQARDLNIQTQIFGSEALFNQAIISDAGSAAEGIIVTAVASGTDKFKRAHKAEYGVEPGIYASQSYDAFKVIYMALEKGATTGEEVQKMLPSISFEGASGQIKFDRFGDVAGNYEAMIVKNGRFETAK